MDNTSIRTAHPIYEDVLALLTAAGFVSLGIFLFHQVGLLTGGTAGLALLLQKVTGISFGLLFFGINLPFYALAWLRMGPRFTFNTFVSVAAVSYMTDHLNGVLQIGKIEPLYAALIGGTLIGMGLLIMFRHKSSLGGLQHSGALYSGSLWHPGGQAADGARLRHCCCLVFRGAALDPGALHRGGGYL